MYWTIAEARQRFSALITAAAHEPQPILRRDRPVAVLVDAETFRAFEAWRAAQHGRSLGAAFAELRTLAEAEGYELALPARTDRPNPFADAADDAAL